MSRGNKKPAVVGGSLSDATWQGEHSDVQRDDQFCTADGRNASNAEKLAYVDAVLASIEMPPGHRRLRREEITPVSTPWPEYIANLAQFSGVDAIVASFGVFLIAERVRVCHSDPLGRPASEVEPGWHCVKLSSVDGKARPHDRQAPQILISPDHRCFILQPEGDLKKQRRVTFIELCDLLGDMGERLARFEVAA